MRLRLAAALVVGLGAAAILVVACGSSDDSTTTATPPPPPSEAGVEPSGDADVVPVNGVAVVHTAAFPAFRLCFENFLDLEPQPDANVMPQANLVGVEVGSVVRIAPLAGPPGKVYVIDQRAVRATPHDPKARTCRALFEDNHFVKNRDYQVAGSLPRPLGMASVDVIALTGCGGQGWLDELHVSGPGDCPGYDPLNGTLELVAVPLQRTTAVPRGALSVQVLALSRLLDARVGSGRLEVTFGPLDAGASEPLAQSVTPSARLDIPTPEASLQLDPTNEAVFGTQGFRVAVRDGDAGTPDDGGLVFDQTLAEVQELSSPQSNPTTYFLAPSSYALLLVGDPRIARTFTDGGANPTFDARRAVHGLAFPLKDDALTTTPDAGQNAGQKADQDGSAR